MAWTKKEIEDHIKLNLGEGSHPSYGAGVVIGALFKKLYGVYPRIGLSGFQGDAAKEVFEELPDKLEGSPDGN